ncbi:MAG: TetR/AcrR family transcriptional regulator [Planctomycetota bacterium]|jgi:TetR/AcrR family transcriptional regulator
MNIKTRSRKASSERRQEIALAVLDLIGAKGAKSLTSAQISNHLGLSAGAIFRHYAGLDEMLEAAVDIAIDLVEQSFPDKNADPKARLLQLGLDRVAIVRTHPGISWLLLSDQGLLGVPEPAAKRIRALVQRSQRFVAQALKQADAAGDLQPDAKPDVSAILLMGAIHALIRTGKNTRAPKPQVVLETLLNMIFLRA